MKYLFITLAIIFTNTHSKANEKFFNDDPVFNQLQKIYICLEKAPVICKYLNLTKAEALQQLATNCVTELPEYAQLIPIWRSGKIIAFQCSYPSYGDQ